MKHIDNFLNKITMYRLVLYYLLLLLAVAAILTTFNLLPFNLFALTFSFAVLVFVSWLTNTIFTKTFDATTNFESIYISALILTLVITPARSTSDIPLLIWAAILTASSKFILSIGKKHLFNPVAISIALTSFALNLSASWWVGTAYMMPFVLIGGLLIVKKTRRVDMVFSFIIVALVTILGLSLVKNTDILTVARRAIMDTPLLFFAFVMLTEPQTLPPTNLLQICYGALVGFLFSPQLQFGTLYTTPETALIIGNVFSYLVSSKQKLILSLKDRVQIASGVYDFVFKPDKKINFIPGQYMEWTLNQKQIDSRGNRRYFTIASSPTEEDIIIGLKYYEKPSSFKSTLGLLPLDGQITASQLAGDFTLPKDQNKKLVFIAGGIGITPFRSMIKYLLDTKQNRQIVLFYSNKTFGDIVYADIFNQAQQTFGLKTVYSLTDTNIIPQNWSGKTGFIDEKMIQEEVPDFSERLFYISGPHAMVTTFENILHSIGVNKSNIKTDYFPGF